MGELAPGLSLLVINVTNNMTQKVDYIDRGSHDHG